MPPDEPRPTPGMSRYAAPTLVLGSIVHGTLVWFRIRRWPAYGLAGCLAGFLIGSALLVPGFSFSYEYERQLSREYDRSKFADALALALIFGGLPGFCAALAFWRALRPDRP